MQCCVSTIWILKYTKDAMLLLKMSIQKCAFSLPPCKSQSAPLNLLHTPMFKSLFVILISAQSPQHHLRHWEQPTCWIMHLWNSPSLPWSKILQFIKTVLDTLVRSHCLRVTHMSKKSKPTKYVKDLFFERITRFITREQNSRRNMERDLARFCHCSMPKALTVMQTMKKMKAVRTIRNWRCGRASGLLLIGSLLLMCVLCFVLEGRWRLRACFDRWDLIDLDVFGCTLTCFDVLWCALMYFDHRNDALWSCLLCFFALMYFLVTCYSQNKTSFSLIFRVKCVLSRLFIWETRKGERKRRGKDGGNRGR